MLSLDYLGGVLENFYEEDIQNPHLIATHITVKEDGKTIASGTSSEIKDGLRDRYNRKIVDWDAYFHMVTLAI